MAESRQHYNYICPSLFIFFNKTDTFHIHLNISSATTGKSHTYLWNTYNQSNRSPNSTNQLTLTIDMARKPQNITDTYVHKNFVCHTL